jgi:peptidoglycan L-alanyl-D-glutamate endopeptidase CwlK
MIHMINYQADPLFWQRFLKCGGFYEGELDGDFGPRSHSAAEDFESRSQDLARRSSIFDIRSESNIQTLQIMAQEKSREFSSSCDLEAECRRTRF